MPVPQLRGGGVFASETGNVRSEPHRVPLVRNGGAPRRQRAPRRRRRQKSAAGTAGLAPAAAPARDPNDGTSGRRRNLRVRVLRGRSEPRPYRRGGRAAVSGDVDVVARAAAQRAARITRGVAAAGTALFAVGGGGVRSNLHDAEALRVVQVGGDGDGSSSWEPCGFVSEARHAVAACATGRLGYLRDRRLGRRRFVYRRGGRAHPRRRDFFLRRRTRRFESFDPRSLKGGRGWVPSDAVLKTRWRSLPRLSTPRKLHAAAGLRDGRLFAFGGRTSDDPNVGPTDSAETFRVPTRTSDDGGSSSSFSESWKPVSPLPAGARARCACVDDADVVAR